MLCTIDCQSLSDLGILSTERDRFSDVVKYKILEMFAQRKARKVKIVATQFLDTRLIHVHDCF